MTARVLIISPQVFPRPFGGTGMRAHFQAVHLSKQYHVTVVSDVAIFEVRDGKFEAVDKQAVPEVSKLSAYLRSIRNGTHYAFEKFNCAKWKMPDFGVFDCIILHYPALLELMPKISEKCVLVILDTHNNDREYFLTVADQIRNPLVRFAMRKQADRSERLIEEWSPSVSATISVSESDRRWAENLFQGPADHFVFPNNLFEFAPVAWSGEKALLYIGTLNISMNLQALDWVRENIWSQVRDNLPELKFIVAGRDPSRELQQELEADGIEVVPNPESLIPLYERAAMSLVPALSGSGGKIKVCESLAHGVPVLTTFDGVVGQPEVIKACCIIRDLPSEWALEIEQQFERKYRTDDSWTERVRSALDETFFGNSTAKIAEFIALRLAQDTRKAD